MPFVSSDPHAWLRPIYARLRADLKFGLLAPAHQFEALAKAIEEETPEKAVAMREWSPAAQLGLLGWLDDLIRQESDPHNSTMLWTVKKGQRDLTCKFVYLPTGIDLRLYEGVEFRRTKLCKDGPEVQSLAEAWRTALLEVGWKP